MFKRFFAVLASILVLLVPFIVKKFDFVEASSANPASDFEWEEVDGGVEITGYTGPEGGHLEIPDQLDGKNVVSIASASILEDGVFYRKGITSVKIPDSVEKIGGYAFYYNNLESVDIPDSVTEIGSGAFRNNNLESVDIPDSVTEIGSNAFYNNNLESVDIPDSVEKIGGYAFYNNNLTSVDIPDSVTEIGSGAFRDNNLESVDIPDSVTEIGSHAFSYNNLESVAIPRNIEALEQDVFSNNHIKDVTLPNNLKTINQNAFKNNKIKDIELPISLKEIGFSAFENNELSGDLVLPEKIDLILWNVFKDNNLDSVTIPNKEVEIFDLFGDPFENNKNNPSDFTLAGIKGSDVERFADEYGYTFKQLNGEVIFEKEGSSTWKQKHSVKVDVYGVSDKKPLEYSWSTSTSTPTSGWKSFQSGDTLKIEDKTGEYYLHIRGESILGDDIKERSNVFKVDNTRPDLSLTLNTKKPTNKDVTLTAKGSDEYSGVKRIRMSSDSFWTNGDTLTKTISENGVYTFEVEDNVGNRTSKSITVDNIDKEKPKISLSSDGGDWARSHSTKITATDDESGIEKLEYRWTTSSSFPSSSFSSTSSGSAVNVPKESGKHYLHVKATDKAGNEAKHTSKAFKIDREKPQLTITSNTTSETHEDVILTAKGKDSYSGVKRIKNPDGKWENKEEVTFTVTKNGTYEFKVEDHAGNTSKESVKVDNINKTMSFKKPTIDNFGSVGLEKEYKRVGISPIKVSDWRDGGNNWRLNVSASNLTNGTDTLPSGLIKLRGVENVNKLSGEGDPPSYSTRESYIDASISEIASGSNSRGEFEIRFVPDALEIHIDPSVMKEGTYETEITWELINAP